MQPRAVGVLGCPSPAFTRGPGARAALRPQRGARPGSADKFRGPATITHGDRGRSRSGGAGLRINPAPNILKRGLTFGRKSACYATRQNPSQCKPLAFSQCFPVASVGAADTIAA